MESHSAAKSDIPPRSKSKKRDSLVSNRQALYSVRSDDLDVYDQPIESFFPGQRDVFGVDLIEEEMIAIEWAPDEGLDYAAKLKEVICSIGLKRTLALRKRLSSEKTNPSFFPNFWCQTGPCSCCRKKNATHLLSCSCPQQFHLNCVYKNLFHNTSYVLRCPRCQNTVVPLDTRWCIKSPELKPSSPLRNTTIPCANENLSVSPGANSTISLNPQNEVLLKGTGGVTSVAPNSRVSTSAAASPALGLPSPQTVTTHAPNLGFPTSPAPANDSTPLPPTLPQRREFSCPSLPVLPKLPLLNPSHLKPPSSISAPHRLSSVSDPMNGIQLVASVTAISQPSLKLLASYDTTKRLNPQSSNKGNNPPFATVQQQGDPRPMERYENGSPTLRGENEPCTTISTKRASQESETLYPAKKPRLDVPQIRTQGNIPSEINALSSTSCIPIETPQEKKSRKRREYKKRLQARKQQTREVADTRTSDSTHISNESTLNPSPTTKVVSHPQNYVLPPKPVPSQSTSTVPVKPTTLAANCPSQRSSGSLSNKRSRGSYPEVKSKAPISQQASSFGFPPKAAPASQVLQPPHIPPGYPPHFYYPGCDSENGYGPTGQYYYQPNQFGPPFPPVATRVLPQHQEARSDPYSYSTYSSGPTTYFVPNNQPLSASHATTSAGVRR